MWIVDDVSRHGDGIRVGYEIVDNARYGVVMYVNLERLRDGVMFH